MSDAVSRAVEAAKEAAKQEWEGRERLLREEVSAAKKRLEDASVLTSLTAEVHTHTRAHKHTQTDTQTQSHTHTRAHLTSVGVDLTAGPFDIGVPC